MGQNSAIDRLRALRDEAESLDRKTTDAWVERARLAVAAAYGEESGNFTRFNNISYSPGVYYSGMPNSIFESSRMSGVRSAVEMLDAFIEDLEAGVGQQPAQYDDVDYAADRRSVMVVHGRNSAVRDAMFEFLRAIDLHPLEWTELVGAANIGAPYIGQVLEVAFKQAQAVVVVSTPGDVALLRASFVPDGDPEREAEPRGQARPNVFIEAGMALGRKPQRTILTELGSMRPASDLLGRFAVRLNNGPECRHDLAQRLANAGCEVKTGGSAWLTAGDFVDPGPAEADATLDQQGTDRDLVRRIDALQKSLIDIGQGFAHWDVAQLYNQLLDDAESDLPRAVQQGPGHPEQTRGTPARSKMTVEQMRVFLAQLRAQL